MAAPDADPEADSAARDFFAYGTLFCAALLAAGGIALMAVSASPSVDASVKTEEAISAIREARSQVSEFKAGLILLCMSAPLATYAWLARRSAVPVAHESVAAVFGGGGFLAYLALLAFQPLPDFDAEAACARAAAAIVAEAPSRSPAALADTVESYEAARCPVSDIERAVEGANMPADAPLRVVLATRTP